MPGLFGISGAGLGSVRFVRWNAAVDQLFVTLVTRFFVGLENHIYNDQH